MQNDLNLSQSADISRFEGIIRCSRYAFGPNRLHYCGPDANREILSYIGEGKGDAGLISLLKEFATMYPYLDFISRVNKIFDPFVEQVVEAYWLGNSLLAKVNKQHFYDYLKDGLKLKKKLNGRSFSLLADKIGLGAIPHHTFHVLNVWNMSGRDSLPRSLENFDACRVNWGQVLGIDGPKLELKYKPLTFIGNKLGLGKEITKVITRKLDSDFDEVKIGDVVSFHWDVLCEVLNEKQIKNLEFYTDLSLKLANKFL